MIRQIVSARNFARTAFRRTVDAPQRAYLGWAGHRNLGDDAMFAAAGALLGERLAILRSPGMERRLLAFKLSGPSMFRKGAVLGGGTLINPDYLSPVENCLGSGLSLVSLGTGVGSAGFSMREDMVDPRWGSVLARFAAVGVRGPLSQESLAAAGFANAEIVGDLALALTPDRPVADFRCKRFIVNCAPARSAADVERVERAVESLAAMVRELSDAGWQPLPVAFDPADREILSRVLHVAGKGDNPIESPDDFDGYLAIARTASVSVGVRLHAAVFAASCGLAPVLIGYRDKCRDFAASLDHEAMVVPLDTIGPAVLMKAVNDAVTGGDSIGARLHLRCAHWRDRLATFVEGFSSREPAAEGAEDRRVEAEQ